MRVYGIWTDNCGLIPMTHEEQNLLHPWSWNFPSIKPVTCFYSTQSQFWFHGSLHLYCISHSFFSHHSFFYTRFFWERVASDGYLVSSSYLSEDKNFLLAFLLSISLPYSKALVEFHEIPMSQARVRSGC